MAASESAASPLTEEHRAHLMLPPSVRTDEQVAALAQATKHLDALALLSPTELMGVIRSATCESLSADETLCQMNDEHPALFIVLSGSVVVEEPRLCHNLGEEANESSEPTGGGESKDGVAKASLRRRTFGVGAAFGHFALVNAATTFDYSAAAGGHGATVLRLLKVDYARLLRRREERQMAETVSRARRTAFFSSWSVAALQRLYFMLERRRLQPGEDVVTQGDCADFCFIIAAGACDIIVSIPPSPETGVLERTERFITRLPAGALVGEADC